MTNGSKAIYRFIGSDTSDEAYSQEETELPMADHSRKTADLEKQGRPWHGTTPDLYRSAVLTPKKTRSSLAGQRALRIRF